jgi:V/A-type H+-transporting ATPase subunit I
MLVDVPFSHHEMPPTVLDNPTPSRPFEFLTSSYSLPNYYEFDPTIIYMITVPLLLGMIVGDTIYGMMMIPTSLWLMKIFKKSYIMSNVSKLWYYSGFTTIIFGLIFDEWFGFHHLQLFQLLGKWGLIMPASPVYAGLNRIHDLSLLIGITVLVGLVHLGIGFILGAMNEWAHSKKHAAAKIAWLGVEIGGTFAVASLILHIPGVPEGLGMAGGILLALSAVVLVLTEGFIGLLEIPGLMGNALSYARIAAIGVVGVVLAEIINEYFAPKPEAGLFLIIIIPLFLVLHFVNMFVAMFEALIQGGRLNLIEFRSKFLKGGGSVFAPFSRKKN